MRTRRKISGTYPSTRKTQKPSTAWTTMLVSAIACSLVMTSCSHPQPHISIFADHIVTLAQQQGIPFAEAAAKVRDMGYTGVDVFNTIRPEYMQALDSLGFEHACAIAWMACFNGPQDDWEEALFAFMEQGHWTRLLLVPTLVPDSASREQVDEAIGRIASFVAHASKRGIDVMMEDFDDPRSLSYNTEALDQLFATMPTLGHVFDTGNYIYCHEDVMESLRHFRPLIRHVHLKDRRPDGTCPAVGCGIVPMREFIGSLASDGYDGWFTVEQYGSDDMLHDAATSIQTIREAALHK